ncbi:MAG: tRNA-dihydrouridine synthase, partial [Holosporales bacterium]|nr:tRNA-dihydrouridine synthase [Holosporales bacterium]
QLLQDSGADGVMVGRGCYGRPWFLKQITHFLKTGNLLPPPPLSIQKNLVFEHFEDILHHYGSEAGLKIARKHLGWYSRGLKDSSEFRAIINQTEDVSGVRKILHSFYDQWLFSQENA